MTERGKAGYLIKATSTGAIGGRNFVTLHFSKYIPDRRPASRKGQVSHRDPNRGCSAREGSAKVSTRPDGQTSAGLSRSARPRGRELVSASIGRGSKHPAAR